jgi:uncharacterized repeat protein (TIGR01451 family)
MVARKLRYLGICGLVLGGAALWAGPAGARELRFSQTAAGQVVATGNTLGLSKEFGVNGPGIEDSIGTFSTLDNGSVDMAPLNAANPWFAGTTPDWTENGSAASLVLPPDAEVLYAELVWGGSFQYGTEDVSANLDDAVTLAFGAESILAEPDPGTAQTFAEVAFSGFLVNYYLRSADVTDFVAAHHDGEYFVTGVPATQDSAINSLNAAGWTLVVAYRDSDERIHNLTVFVGGSFVDEDTTEDYEFSGFCTPPSGAFEGRAVVSAIEGDADLTGDSLAIAEDAGGPFVLLSTPNNPVDNFFASQLNDADGMLDPSGTFGDRNHDAAAGTNAIGGRQGWDVTSIFVSSAENHFSNGQTSAVLRTQTTGDSYVPVTVAFAIGVNAPNFSGDGTFAAIEPSVLEIDDTATITVDMENDGLVDATGLVFRASIPEGLALSSFTLDGNPVDAAGNPVDAAGLDTGVPIGDVPVGQTRHIVIEVTAEGPPADGEDSWSIVPQWTYDYVSCVGEPPLTEPYSAPAVHVDFEPAADTTGGPDDTTGAVDDTAGTSDSASATNGDDDASASATMGDASADASATDTLEPDTDSAGVADSNDGCGCRSDRPARGGAWWLALMLLPMLRRQRGSGRNASHE